MKARELIAHLSKAQDVTVLMLLCGCDAGDALEVQSAVSPTQAWLHERHHRRDGGTDDFYAPASFGVSEGFDESTDEVMLERVVVLVADKASAQYVTGEVHSGRLSMSALRAQALERRRAMVESGELVREDVFSEKSGVRKKRLAKMVNDGRLFVLEVDGELVYPSILCNDDLLLHRLWRVAKILMPAPPELRLDFLTSKSVALGSRIPIDLLERDRDYRKLRKYATAWASEFSRTFVKVFNAEDAGDLASREPLYTCAAEIDPRRPLWRRALEAVRAPGYQLPHEAPPCPPVVLLVVELHTAGRETVQPEARIVCDIRATNMSVSVAIENELPLAIKVPAPRKRPSVADVANAVFAALARS